MIRRKKPKKAAASPKMPMLTGQMMHRGQVVMQPGLPLKKKPKGR